VPELRASVHGPLVIRLSRFAVGMPLGAARVRIFPIDAKINTSGALASGVFSLGAFGWRGVITFDACGFRLIRAPQNPRMAIRGLSRLRGGP
jgi:hypothetical protein